MKAWQFTNTHEPLVLNEIDDPKPGPGEVLIEPGARGSLGSRLPADRRLRVCQAR